MQVEPGPPAGGSQSQPGSLPTAWKLVFAGVVSVSIALPLAYALWRHRVFYAKALFALGIAPFILPPVITALGFLIFWGSLGYGGRIENTIISHGIFLVTLPLMTI